LPTDGSNKSKGFAFVLFSEPESAVEAFEAADGAIFQGRILHVLAGSAKREAMDEFELSKLPLKQQNLLRKKMKAATSKFNWNSLYMNQDAVNTSMAERLGISKSELLDPTNADSAVQQAIAETSVIQDTKAYFLSHGVDLNAFKSSERGDTSILVKNFYGTPEEMRQLFEEHGRVLRVLVPPAGTIAVVEFAQASEAKSAFAKLAYRRFKNTVLYLEKGPKNLFVSKSQQTRDSGDTEGIKKSTAADFLGQDNPEDDAQISSLFIGNLNFSTTTDQLMEKFRSLEGFKSALVKTKTDPKKPGQVLSMGFGFAHFNNRESAQAALKAMDGQSLHAHKLQVKASHRGLDAAAERKRDDEAKKAAGQRTKIIIKNLPFEASKKDVRALMGTYGQLRTVRVPKNISNRSKGFAFAEFVSAREAENAMSALQSTHLLGRKLVLQFAEADIVDPELEIAKMQQKVGGQVNKVALQQLTSAGRKRFDPGQNEDEEGI
jgi:multiple RNA-binding domain-containing protein 1